MDSSLRPDEDSLEICIRSMVFFVVQMICSNSNLQYALIEIAFKIRYSTQLSRVFDAYKDRVKNQGLRFAYRGKRLDPNETAGSVGLQNGDVIDASIYMLVGTECPDTEHVTLSAAGNGIEVITIRVKGPRLFCRGYQSEIIFQINKKEPLSPVFDAFCDRVGRPPGSLLFFFKERRINGKQTAESIQLRNGNTIEAVFQRAGVSDPSVPQIDGKNDAINIKVKGVVLSEIQLIIVN